MIETSAFEIAQRFTGIKEVAGIRDNPMILAMLRLDGDWPEHDEVPWCSAFVNFVCWLLRLPRSKSLRARSWLGVGHRISLEDARVGCDVVVISRGEPPQPGPESLARHIPASATLRSAASVGSSNSPHSADRKSVV